jgi:hypothetical protein
MVGEEKERVMEDLGNIIYLIIGIGWFLWNAYRKSQQGKEQRKPERQRPHSVPSETSEPSSDPFKTLEDMILEQLEGKKEPVMDPVVIREKRHDNQDKFLNMDLDHSHLPDNYKMSVGEGGSHRVQRQVRPLNMVESEPENSVMDELFPEGFELKKAVVFNAILERPYG